MMGSLAVDGKNLLFFEFTIMKSTSSNDGEAVAIGKWDGKAEASCGGWEGSPIFEYEKERSSSKLGRGTIVQW